MSCKMFARSVINRIFASESCAVEVTKEEENRGDIKRRSRVSTFSKILFIA